MIQTYLASNTDTQTFTPSYLCPDLLRLSQIGPADNWRGHVVRGFFRLLGWLTGV